MQFTVAIPSEKEQIDAELSLLNALHFGALETLDLVYIIEILSKTDALIGVSAFMDNLTQSPYQKLQKRWAEEAVAYAVEGVKSLECSVNRHIFKGQIANRILAYAQEQKSSLIVLGSDEKNVVEGILVGSVTRKTAIHSPTSVLIARGHHNSHKKLKAVVATDHSEYANSCLKLLLQYRPQGLSDLVVTTVYPADALQDLASSTPHFKLNVEEAVIKQLHEKNREVMDLLGPLNCQKISSRVEAGLVPETLTRVMEEEEADLLILGAQGHGFTERLMIGSVSLQLTLTQKKSVLLLRDHA